MNGEDLQHMSTEQQEIFFKSLVEDRKDSIKTLKKASMRGVWSGVIEKYTDKAHFVYELLQNADDAGARHARFILHSNCLIFSHDGTRPFTVSDPSTEEADAANHKLGDINAITSIGQSGKNGSFLDNTPKIGKFGLGFKAVFAYTKTPSIYSANFNFRLNDYIVPELIESSHPEQQPGETLFDFPFDNDTRSPQKAFEDISQKLQNLVLPLLFLNTLESISYRIDDLNIDRTYSQKILENGEYDGVTYRRISFEPISEEAKCPNEIWLFSDIEKKDTGEELKYSVGIFTDRENRLLPVSMPAFCFFPTKAQTNLEFVIHAPFLLTDNREGIRAGEKHNQQMIELLADLSAKSFLALKAIGEQTGRRLIDDDILDIIPYEEGRFASDGIDDISFVPFYNRIKNAFLNNELLPTKNGYVHPRHAHWSDVSQYIEIFDDQELRKLVANENASWVFRSKGRDRIHEKSPQLAEYVQELGVTWHRDFQLLSRLTPGFIETIDIEWLPRLYKFICATESRIKFISERKIIIFLDQNRHACGLYKTNGDTNLFLPAEDQEYGNYNVIHPELYKHEETQNIAKRFNIHLPSLKDEIYNQILPLYDAPGDKDFDVRRHFDKFFQFYSDSPAEEQKKFVKRLSSCQFILCKHATEPKNYIETGDSIYFPTKDLIYYFIPCGDILFVDLQEYDKWYKTKKDEFEHFLSELGVSWQPRLQRKNYTLEEAKTKGFPWGKGAYSKLNQQRWFSFHLEGLDEALDNAASTKKTEISIAIWKVLCSYATKSGYSFINGVYVDTRLKNLQNGFYAYSWHGPKQERFPIGDLPLSNKAWLSDANGQFRTPTSMSLKAISPNYDQNMPGASDLIELLNFKPLPFETKQPINDFSCLSPELQARLPLNLWAQRYGLSEEEAFKALRQASEQKKCPQSEDSSGVSDSTSDNDKPTTSPSTLDEADEPSKNGIDNLCRSIRDAAKTNRERRQKDKLSEDTSSEVKPDIEPDADIYTRPVENIERKIKETEAQFGRAIDELAHRTELLKTVAKNEKYSFGWFRYLLELEADISSERTQSSISISFNSVEREEGTERTLILRQPDRNIPQSLEDLENIPLELHFTDSDVPDRKLPIEVISVKSYTLRVKLKDSSGLNGLPWTKISGATIRITNPDFLQRNLLKHFCSLHLQDDYAMKENLPGNLSFVFGPPGTGKTTFLANWMRRTLQEQSSTAEIRILVLAPTNKAVDVIVNRILSLEGRNDCSQWLVRFGSTQDSSIEQNPVFIDRVFDYASHKRCILATTIARFSYDYIVSGEDNIPLASIKWDYVVIDEASMIPLVTIMNVIYHQNPVKFIISGDPFQIEPITSLEQWKNENIYTCVELNSFKTPKTAPHDFEVIRLDTQYRSIPSIGKVFSQLTYDGILQHKRAETDQRILLLNELDMRPLNIVKFRVSPYESIYRAKKLNSSSSYHVYSALLALEFFRFLNNNLQFSKDEGEVTIGIVTPYAAQASLIERMISTINIREDIKVNVGTIHSFQGDECNIIIDVVNPPPSISSNPEMFLNKKNITNVSISRARDYLFLLVPDSQTKDVENLRLLHRLESLCMGSGYCQEIEASTLEKIIFKDANFLEKNSFATGHLSVNVYSKPEFCYEVRSEDSAIDVQIVTNEKTANSPEAQ